MTVASNLFTIDLLIQWILFICILYYLKLYSLPLLIASYLFYLYKFPKDYGKPYGFKSNYVQESLIWFTMGIATRPITFLLDVLGIPSKDLPKDTIPSSRDL